MERKTDTKSRSSKLMSDNGDNESRKMKDSHREKGKKDKLGKEKEKEKEKEKDEKSPKKKNSDDATESSSSEPEMEYPPVVPLSKTYNDLPPEVIKKLDRLKLDPLIRDKVICASSHYHHYSYYYYYYYDYYDYHDYSYYYYYFYYYYSYFYSYYYYFYYHFLFMFIIFSHSFFVSFPARALSPSSSLSLPVFETFVDCLSLSHEGSFPREKPLCTL